jgi:hypothetical protein
MEFVESGDYDGGSFIAPERRTPQTNTRHGSFRADSCPLENILVLQNYKENIDLIMKNGKVYKDTL